jgi:hypothetical protein
MFSILDPVRMRKAVDPVEKLTDWKLFQSLASELISSNKQIYSSNDTDKAACDFTASLALVYKLSTRRTAILDQKYEIVYLDLFLKHKRKLRTLWQETTEPACKTAENWVTQNIRNQEVHLKDGKQSWQSAKSHLQ